MRTRISKRMTRLLGVAIVVGMSTIAGCAHRQKTPGADTFEARRQLAHELVMRGDWQPAFAYVDQLHREQPDDARVLVLRATIYRERDLLGEAAVDLNEAIRLDPGLAAARAALGILCDMQRRPVDAEEQHRQAVKIEPKNPVYLNNLGFSLFLHGKIKEAISFYEQAARLSPTAKRTRTNLGFAYAARGDLHRAAREFEMGGTPAEAKINLGFAYERRGDMTNAFDLYVEAARLDPKSQRARMNLAHAAEVTGRSVPVATRDEAASDDVPASGAIEVPTSGRTREASQ